MTPLLELGLGSVTGLYAEERGVEGREDRLRELSSCFGVEVSTELRSSDSGSRMVHTVDKD